MNYKFNLLSSIFVLFSIFCFALAPQAVFGQVFKAPEVICAKTDSSSIQFIWSTVDGASGYEIRIGDQDWTNVRNSLSVVISGLSLDSTLGIWVRVLNAEPKDSSFTRR